MSDGYDYAPTAKGPRDYVEGKLGRSLTNIDAKSQRVFDLMEAFAAGEDSFIVNHIELFRQIHSSLKSRNRGLASVVEMIIKQGESKIRSAAKAKKAAKKKG